MNDTGIHRIRLSSVEVNEIDDELIELLQDRRMCRHLHLPLQSGSGRILSLMKRTYTAKTYTSKVEAIASKIDNISLGTDLIIGFPGEEDLDFSDTYSLVSNLPFSYLHIFPFSARPDTEASLMKNRNSPRKVSDRLERMRVLHRRKREEYMAKQLQRKIEIIIEERLSQEMVSGTSGNYLKVRAFSTEHNKGSLAIVRAESVLEGSLCGVIIE
jgi:threonylcarbamoyladenosine tRNA methylthiotransferase MtaB